MGITYFTPTSLAYVYLCLLNFCLTEVEYIYSFPIEIVAPMWLLIYNYTTNNDSAYHLTTCVLSDSRVRGVSVPPLRYMMTRTSFLLFSLSGTLNIVVRNAIAYYRPHVWPFLREMLNYWSLCENILWCTCQEVVDYF